MIKRVVYYEQGSRKVRDFHVEGKHKFDGLRIDKESEVESIRFVKTVDYKVSVYLD